MKTQIAAIEFGTSKIVTVIAQNSGGDRLEIAGSGTVPYDGFGQNREWNTPAQMIRCVRDSIAAAEYESKQKIKEIYVGVPGQFIHVVASEAQVVLPDGVVDDIAMAEIADEAADRLNLEHSGAFVLHRVPVWYQTDDDKVTYNPIAQKGKQLRAKFTFILADPVFLDDVQEILGALNITILGFLSPTLGESMLVTSYRERDNGAVIINCGFLSTEISVLEHDAIVYHAMLPYGGADFNVALVERLHIPLRSAEQVKRRFVFNPDETESDAITEVPDGNGKRVAFSRKEVAPIMEGVFSDIAELLERVLADEADTLLNQHSAVLLTGGGLALMRGAKEALSEKLRRTVKICTVKASKMTSPIFASALGLADFVFDSIEETESGGLEDVFLKAKNLFAGNKSISTK